MPIYPGGDAELINFPKNNTNYPEEIKAEKIERRIIIGFIVTTEGNSEGISILKEVHPLPDIEAIMVISSLEACKPVMQNGKHVNTWFMLW
jgi:protein TonB